MPVGRKGYAGVKQRRESISFPEFNIWFMSWNGVGQIGEKKKNTRVFIKLETKSFNNRHYTLELHWSF